VAVVAVPVVVAATAASAQSRFPAVL